MSLIFTHFDDGEYYACFYNGFNLAAKDQNIELSSTILNSSFEESLERLKKMGSKNIDGLILFAPKYTREDYKTIKEILPDKYPVVSNGLIENPIFSTVTFDGYSGGYSTAKHFEDQGYEKCGMIRGAFDAIEARYRSNGFKDYIIQAENLELIWDYSGDFSFNSGREAFNAFHKAKEKPRAVFASNDSMGHAFIREALIHGYDIPGDIAVVGYDDLPICNRLHPSISSIHTDYRQLGDVTMKKLKDLLSNPGQEKGVLSLLPVNLEVRESS